MAFPRRVRCPPPADRLQEVTWPSEQGGHPMYAHLLLTWIRKFGPTLLLLTCHDRDIPRKSIRYWDSSRLDLEA